MEKTKHEAESRRSFLQKSTLAAAGFSTFMIAKPEHVRSAEANSKIQLGVIGTGGRGQYDSRNLVKTGKVKVVALADYFDFQIKELARAFEVPETNCFDGLDGYKKILAMENVDAVLLTTAPYFRPMQFEAAIDAGKHVFAEKPIAVDPWGCRKFLAASNKAKNNKQVVGAGLQTRYEVGHQRVAELIHEGAIGIPVVGHSTRMGGDLWRRERPDHFTERDHQIRHWLYYLWASGDFICEMHIHNLDVFNWFSGLLPTSAVGTGGRKARLDVGDIYDHIQVFYDYPKGFSLTHTGTQIQAGYKDSVKHIVGTEGYFEEKTGLFTKDGKNVKANSISGATEVEMRHFVESVLGERPYLNNGEYVTTSTFTSILGRTAAYRNERILWDDLWESNERIQPTFEL